MKHKNLALFFLIWGASQAAHPADTSTVDDTRAAFSATPRLVRENPTPQVFFEDSDSLRISTSSVEAYNRIMNAVNGALRAHRKVKLFVNRNTNIIVDADGPPPTPAVSVYDDTEDAPKSAVTDKPAKAATPTPAAAPAAGGKNQ